MLIHVFSDLHADTWHRRMATGETWFDIPQAPEPGAPVLVISAGDQGNGMSWTTYSNKILVHEYGKAGYRPRLFTILGNHDYYALAEGKKVQDLTAEVRLRRQVINRSEFGLKVAGTTLWTNFWGRGEIHMRLAETNIMDFYKIPGLTGYLLADLYEEERAWLIEQKADIVVTHFPPTLESVHAMYKGDMLNPYFVNDDAELVEACGAKIWIHGHTHNVFDYMVGETRVVANPVGYPGEIRIAPPFRPLILEV